MQRYEEQLEKANSTIEDLRSQLASVEQQNTEFSHENAGLKAASGRLSNQVKDQQAQIVIFEVG